MSAIALPLCFNLSDLIKSLKVSIINSTIYNEKTEGIIYSKETANLDSGIVTSTTTNKNQNVLPVFPSTMTLAKSIQNIKLDGIAIEERMSTEILWPIHINARSDIPIMGSMEKKNKNMEKYKYFFSAV